jgi:hypothetical protein
VRFIREKGKATAREVQWSREAGNSLLRGRLELLWTFNSGLEGGFLIGRAFQGLSNWFGSALWEIYQTLYLSLGCRNAVYNSLSGCRNAGL